MLRNFIELLNFLLCQAYQCLKKNELKDISKCLLQIEASQEDIKSGIKSFQNLRTNIESISNNLKSHFYQKKMNETYQENISALENIVFSSSPVITINTNCRDEGNDVLKRLELTPIEGILLILSEMLVYVIMISIKKFLIICRCTQIIIFQIQTTTWQY